MRRPRYWTDLVLTILLAMLLLSAVFVVNFYAADGLRLLFGAGKQELRTILQIASLVFLELALILFLIGLLPSVRGLFRQVLGISAMLLSVPFAILRIASEQGFVRWLGVATHTP